METGILHPLGEKANQKPVQLSIEQLRECLREDHKRLGNWRDVSYEWKMPPGTLCRIAERAYEPKRPDIRRCLGLPIVSTVVVVGGESIPDGAQVYRADVCPCGQWYISNHPRRKRCFICSPYRRRVK